ncbi:hypothetical protein Poli38472_003337 [Pythium oligandrum]|uniref:Symplekin n=1 Tax=Pythium oligandrum TaxID=41045 RepID=A0A8K1C6G1_PYTOL|nr:hypothetical protein Poli38472_003337 [Pythium oligandrum]|eukprot:TMW57412.1 hypothetical protein Poli38472_003337 [Pythium oligandrum]
MATASEVVALLQQIPTADGNAQQLELFHRATELALHRDASGQALHAALPFLHVLAQQQNAPLVQAILQLLKTATPRDRRVGKDLFEVATALLMLSFASEKNVLTTLEMTTNGLADAFGFVADATAPTEQLMALWTAVTTHLEHTVDVLTASPLSDVGSNRSPAVFLAAWKYIERAVLLLSVAKDATVYRDPARSNIQPDAVTIDRLPTDHAVLNTQQLERLGAFLLERLCQRLATPSHAMPLTRREICVMVNSLALLAALRPQFMRPILTQLVACTVETFPASSDRVVQMTLRANLVKLLSHPSAQELSEEVTEALIALGDSERAFRAISKSKDPRRKYVSAPSEASLRRARIGKRTADRLSETVANDPAKRVRKQDVPVSSAASEAERVTHDALVNIPSEAIVNLVLSGFASEMRVAPPPNLKLQLPPSELKTRMAALLSKLATPSSAFALETSQRRSRDPRRRRDPRTAAADADQPALIPVFDEEVVEEVSDWISKNASTIDEPVISVAEDNSIQVFLKPVSSIWCRDMASAALSRILGNEYGARIRGDEQLREAVICRLASNPWLLLTDDQNRAIHVTPDSTKLPPVYESILAFVLEDYASRMSLATALFDHEFIRFTEEQLRQQQVPEEQPPVTCDALYRKAVDYFLTELSKAIDVSSASDRKLFGGVVAQLPRVTVEVLRLLNGFLANKTGAVLAISVLRDLIRERKGCAHPALRILLRYACDDDETCRTTSIRCVANQLYVMETLKEPIEAYAVKLVQSLETKDDGDVAMVDTETLEEGETDTAPANEEAPVDRAAWLRRHITALSTRDTALKKELSEYATDLATTAGLDHVADSEVETLRRVELLLALCAKKPSLLRQLVTTYGHASESVRQVIFTAIEKLIKHLKQRGSINVVAHLHGFTASSLGLICHIIQILSMRSRSSASAAEETAANAELVSQVLDLWHAHTEIPDAISVLIPILSSIPKESLFPLLPTLLALPQSRWSVAITRVLEAMPPQVITPIDLLLGLHRVDLKSEATMQKRVIAAINFCVENRHAFPAEVMLHVCRTLVHDERISRLALRTLILSVTTYPTLQDEMAKLLDVLVDRRVWEMEEDVLWKGFVKCAALIQPASFKLLLEKLPAPQLEAVLSEERGLRDLLFQYVATQNIPVSSEVRAVLDSEQEPKQEEQQTEAMDVELKTEAES